MKPVKIRYDQVQPKDIVDFWRLYEKFIKECKPEHPDLSEEVPESIRAHLYNMIASSRFIGFIAKQGRKPVGMIGGMVAERPFGSPRVFTQVLVFFVEPDFRKKLIGGTLVKELFAASKKIGVHYFEITADAKFSESIGKVLNGKGSVVSHKVFGKIPLE